MSRIGKRNLTIPENVKININDDVLLVNGKLGELKLEINPLVEIVIEQDHLSVKMKSNSKQAHQLQGTFNSIIENMIHGVTNGYEKELELKGVGYRVEKQGNKLVLSLALSHKVEMEIPSNLEVDIPKQTSIIVKGIDKQQVGLFAAKIRKQRPPEPYGGKGILYKGERIIRKQGKAAAKKA